MEYPQYHNQIGKVPVGEIYESVTIEDGTIQKGDIVVWDDPDVGYRDESIVTSLFVGYVEKIYKRDNPELGTSMPLGRIGIDRNLVGASGKEIYRELDGCCLNRVDQFLSSNYEKYMQLEWTRNGDFQVSGE